MARHVQAEGAETINGVKTFGSFPITPSSAPSADYEVANKKFVLDNARPYKIYVAKLYQIDTADPVVYAILESTYGSITFDRTSPGFFKCISDGEFTEYKTVVFISALTTLGTEIIVELEEPGGMPDYFEISTSLNGSLSDNILELQTIEIRTYP